ncbi:hypothetical protein [uncultured Deinococcus sp.]|uniref:hypothetical protein n=1 Tax=uncultured Deinococcus sp. TaxID=158789 RepID=UPI0025E43400|nr:hypothetical protein [uncultured Deinococcus sp.]
MLQLARTTRTLETLGAALERSGFAAQSTPSSLTFHAPGQAVAHIAPSDTPEHWIFEVMFAVDDLDTARGAARHFAQQHGGRLRLRGQTLILSSDVARLDLEHVVALYHTAGLLQNLLDAAHGSARH